jgi:hypothetical protein
MKHVRDCCVVLALLFLCGCATTKPLSPNPEILSNTISGGKGSPWGRSDSSANFTKLTATTSDPTYGLTEQNPIKVGGLAESNEAEYLNGLRGPSDEPIEYERLGSCCPFKTPNAMIEGIGLLDAFRVTYAGQAKPSILYIDFYDKEPLFVPVGFKARSN